MRGIALDGYPKSGSLIKIKSADLLAYKGQKIDYVKFLVKEMDYNTSCKIVVREGKVENAGYEQVVDIASLIDDSFNSIKLTTPYEIKEGVDIFVGIMIEGTGASNPIDNDGTTEQLTSDILYNYYDDQDNYWSLEEIFGVSGDFMIEAIISDETGTGVIERTKDVGVFPNPFNNEIKISGLENASQISIYNITGKVVLSTNKFTTQLTLPTTDMVKGIYLLRITNHDGSKKTVRIIKE